MSKMRVVQVTQPNGPFELVEREIPEPTAGQVRIKVEACGIWHSDSLVKEGASPAFSIREFRDMRWPDSLTLLAAASWVGPRASGSALVGTAGIVGTASP